MKKISLILSFLAIISLGLSQVMAVKAYSITEGNGVEIVEPKEEESVSGSDIPKNEQESSTDRQVIEKKAREKLKEILADRTLIALVYLSDSYPIRMEASYDSQTVVSVSSGQQVQIQDVCGEENGEIWVYVTFSYLDIRYDGYIPRSYLACSDEEFLEWESMYGMNLPNRLRSFSLARTSSPSYPDIAQFPASYQKALTELKQKHPNWTFVKMNTGLNWNTVVKNEMLDGRSLIESSFPAYMHNGIYSPGWAYATEDSLKYYLDPRNWLNEEYIFQFELLTYNKSYHKETGVQAFLNNTFMKGKIPDDIRTYANVFYTTGEKIGVSPFHLACRVYQEQGPGTSSLISGNYPGYEGYYNFFNIAASGNTDKAIIESGLKKAKEEGWNKRYLSIEGGARVLGTNYILRGQDTLYLQKFDVDNTNDGLYWHQYMQNICAPSSEGRNIKKSYANVGSLENTFIFKIPVYENMPSSPFEVPGYSYEIGLKPPVGYTNANIYLDGVEYKAVLQNGRYVVKAPNGNAGTAIMYRYNKSNIPVGMYVWKLSYKNGVYTALAIPELENLLSYHGFSVRITGKSGIRFKTGISAALRKKLTSSGVAGYKVKEYGTLVMDNANRKQYPLVKNGTKVAGGRSYGINEKGKLEDKIYERVSGRYRFTSVLVGLPANQYKTEFAFRGYIILTKDGQDITLYGPTVWKSIYSLSEQAIASGQYKKGSSADKFLKKIIKDAK